MNKIKKEKFYESKIYKMVDSGIAYGIPFKQKPY